MARLRYNNLTGHLGAALTNTGTALTLTAPLTHDNGIAVPTIVAPDFIPITIDPGLGTYETVSITAYTSGAITATIQRGVEGSAGAHLSGATFSCDLTSADANNLQQGYNVKDFGAKGDGITDDTTNIQNTLDELGKSNGGVVYMPRGTYVISGPLNTYSTASPSAPYSNIVMRGENRDTTKVITSGTGHMIQVMGIQGGLPGGSIQGTPGATIQTISNVLLENFTVDLGGKSGQGLTTSWCDRVTLRRIRITNAQSSVTSLGPRLLIQKVVNNVSNENLWLLIDDCLFDNFNNDSHIEALSFNNSQGIRVINSEFTNNTFCNILLWTQAQESLIQGNWFHDCQSAHKGGAQGCHGVSVKFSSPDTKIIANRFERLGGGWAINNAGGNNADDYGWNNSTHLLIHDNTIIDCGVGIAITGGTEFAVTKNHIHGCSDRGIFLGGDGAGTFRGVIKNNFISNIGQLGTNDSTHSAIQFQSACGFQSYANIIVEGNTVVDTQTVPTTLYAIGVDTKAWALNGVTFEHNDFTAVGTPVKVISGSLGPATVFRNNRGLNPIGVVATGSAWCSGGNLVPSITTSGTAIQNNQNADAVIYLTSGGGTAVSTSINAIPEPSWHVFGFSVPGSSGNFTTGNNTLGISLGNANGYTLNYTSGAGQVGFNINTSTDQVMLSALPMPTAIPVLTQYSKNNSALPSGQYIYVQTWTNENGETSVPTTSVNGAGQTINTTASTFTVISTNGFTGGAGTFAVNTGTVSSPIYTAVNYTSTTATTFVGCTVASGSFTPTNGNTVIMAGAITISNGGGFNLPQLTLPLDSAGKQLGINGAKVYLLPGSPVAGLCCRAPVSFGTVPNIPATSLVELPWILPAPKISPVCQDASVTYNANTGLPVPLGNFTTGSYSFAFSYFGSSGFESVVGPASPSVNIGLNRTDSASISYTAGSNTLSDPSLLASDVWATVSNGDLPSGTLITSVVPGVSAQMSNNANKTGTASVTLTRLGSITINQTNLDILPIAAGQISVAFVGVYAVGASPLTGLIAKLPIVLPATQGGADNWHPSAAPYVAQYNTNGITGGPPQTYDASFPPSYATRSDGWRVNTVGGPAPTSARFWLNGTSYVTQQAPANGVIAPFTVTTTGTVASPPSVNGSGNVIATTTLPLYPLRIKAGDAFVPQWTGAAPTAVWQLE